MNIQHIIKTKLVSDPTFLDLSDLPLPSLEFLSEVGGGAEILQLSLHGATNLEDLTPLEGLTNLEHLDLSWCVRIKDLTPLSKLKNLRSLDLSSCFSIERATPLKTLNHLEHLAITPLSGITSESILELNMHQFTIYIKRITPPKHRHWNCSALFQTANLHKLNNVNAISCKKLLLW